MSDAAQRRLAYLLATGIAYVLSHQLADRFIDIREQRGIRDDMLKAALKGATTTVSTALAWFLVRKVLTRL